MFNRKENVEIFNLDHLGRGIGRIDNKIIFIPNTLKGEIVDVNIVLDKKKFFVGDLIKIDKIAKERINPICPHFYRCGGCDLMHMNYENELKYKEEKVKDIMSKYADLEPALVKSIIPNETRHNYRNKVTFKVGRDLGFYEKNSNNLVSVDYCYIVDNRINELIRYINKNIILDGIKSVVVRKSKNNDDLMIIFQTSKKIDEEKIKKVLGYATSIYIYENNHMKLIKGEATITEEIRGLKFNISPSAFFQVNTSQAEKLFDKVIEIAKIKKTDTVLELFSGTGTISLLLAKEAKKVYAVEINEHAVADAKNNAQQNNITNIEFIEDDAHKFVKNFDKKIDVLVVDPPRSGLDDKSIKGIIELKPKKFIYISCDPMTLARDLKKMSSEYQVKEIIPLDMFSNTYHVETIVLLEKRV